MTRSCNTPLFVLGLLLLALPAVAGNNAEGTAQLSWAQSDIVSNLTEVPTLPAPLYLVLQGTPDIQQLAVTIRWSPRDSIGPCYELIPADSTGGYCGSTGYLNPPGIFEGDSSYTWSISFDGSSRSCVVYRVAGQACTDRPANFCLASVETKDSNGEIDQLVLNGNATILGGVPDGCPAVVQDVFPHTVVAGRQNTLEIQGANFAGGTWVTLQSQTGTASSSSSSVVSQDAHTLNASIDVPTSFAGPISVVVGTGQSTADTLGGQLSVAEIAALEYAPDKILVWFKPGVVGLPLGQTSASVAATAFNPTSVSQTLSVAGATDLRMLTPTANADNLAGLDSTQLDMYVVSLADTNVIAAIATLQADSANVLLAEPDWRRQAYLVPNDQYFGQQWWLRNTGQFYGVAGKDLHAIFAWDRSTGAAPVDVVVLDTGSDIDHPDLAGRVIYGPTYISGTTSSYDDASGSHGTSVSGMIAAQGGNTIGVAGVDWTSRIVAVKVLDAFGGGDTDEIDAGVDWARANGYKILNLSLGGGSFSRTEERVFKNAYMAGMAVFVAMGNDNCACISYPAGYVPFVIAVGAMMNNGDRWDDYGINWSNFGLNGPPDVDGDGLPDYFGSDFGSHIHFIAPGGRFIETTRSVATGSYWTVAPNLGAMGFGGTSAATPAASGTAALVQSVVQPTNMTLSGEDLDHVLLSTAVQPTGYQPGFNNYTGWGVIDADGATGMVTGQYRVEHGQTSSVADVAQQDAGQRTILDWPGITPGNYFATRHVMQATINFANSFIATPAAWARKVSSYGAQNENPIAYAPTTGTSPTPWTPKAWVSSVNQQQVTLQTYVYYLSPVGGGQHYWWPTTTSGVTLAYTAIGPISLVGVESPGAPTTLRFSIAPNPVRGRSGFQLALPEAGPVKLGIYDVAGRLLKRLESRVLPAGEHRFVWDLTVADGHGAAGGLYFARLESPSGTRVVRFVVLR